MGSVSTTAIIEVYNFTLGIKSHVVCCLDDTKSLCGTKLKQIKLLPNQAVTCGKCIELDELATIDDCLDLGICLVDKERNEN